MHNELRPLYIPWPAYYFYRILPIYIIAYICRCLLNLDIWNAIGSNDIYYILGFVHDQSTPVSVISPDPSKLYPVLPFAEPRHLSHVLYMICACSFYSIASQTPQCYLPVLCSVSMWIGYYDNCIYTPLWIKIKRWYIQWHVILPIWHVVILQTIKRKLLLDGKIAKLFPTTFSWRWKNFSTHVYWREQ